MEIETVYTVQYQQDNKPHWWQFTGYITDDAGDVRFHETPDMDLAQAVAARLYDGEIHTSPNPECRDNVTRTRVFQQIYVSGPLITFPSEKTNE